MEHWKIHTPFGFTDKDLDTTITNNPDGSRTTYTVYSNGLKTRGTQHTDGSIDFECNKQLVVDEVKKEIVPNMDVDNSEWKD